MFGLPKSTALLAGVGVAGIIGLAVASGYVGYNDAGYCTHVQTVFGTEDAKCDLGWYVKGWGTTTEYPHFITIAHTADPTAEGSSVNAPYAIRLNDNWSGDVTQTTRFGIPRDRDQFLAMHNEFRGVGRLVTSTLVPAVTASLDSTANLYSMEEYFAGGGRDAFKTDFTNALTKGRPVTRRVEVVVDGVGHDPNTAPSASDVAADTAQTGGDDRVRVVTERVLDASGNEVRIPHSFGNFGVTVSSAILTNLDPVDEFEVQIQKRKEAAARRVIAVEQRLEQEEQRLLAIAEGERNIAERQAEARVEQIAATTAADTEKRLALIAAEQQREQANIAKQTSAIALEKARIDAEAVQVTADAEAYARRAVLEADNALQAKLDAEVSIQAEWAQAYAQRKVPALVFGGAGDGVPVGSDAEASMLIDLLTAQAAERLAYDRAVPVAE